MICERLKYAGRGQIVLEKTGQLVSPRDIVTAWNRMYDERITANAEMLAACAVSHEQGDDSLCRARNCPYYGEPNGCNHPRGGF